MHLISEIFHKLAAAIIILGLSASLNSAPILAAEASSADFTVKFEGYHRATEDDPVQVVVFSININNTYPMNASTNYDIANPISCNPGNIVPKGYLFPSKTIRNWMQSFKIFAKQTDWKSPAIIFNSSFFRWYPTNNIDGAICGRIIGYAATSGTELLPHKPNDCNDDGKNCHIPDAMFISQEQENRVAAIIESTSVSDYFVDHKSGLLLAQGGIIFLKDGIYTNPAAMENHKRDDKAARMAIGICCRNIATEKFLSSMHRQENGLEIQKKCRNPKD